jgi:hypothetical protein
MEIHSKIDDITTINLAKELNKVIQPKVNRNLSQDYSVNPFSDNGDLCMGPFFLTKFIPKIKLDGLSNTLLMNAMTDLVVDKFKKQEIVCLSTSEERGFELHSNLRSISNVQTEGVVIFEKKNSSTEINIKYSDDSYKWKGDRKGYTTWSIKYRIYDNFITGSFGDRNSSYGNYIFMPVLNLEIIKELMEADIVNQKKIKSFKHFRESKINETISRNSVEDLLKKTAKGTQLVLKKRNTGKVVKAMYLGYQNGAYYATLHNLNNPIPFRLYPTKVFDFMKIGTEDVEQWSDNENIQSEIEAERKRMLYVDAWKHNKNYPDLGSLDQNDDID